MKISFIDKILNKIADRIYLRLENRLKDVSLAVLDKEPENFTPGWRNPGGVKVLKTNDLAIDKQKQREKEVLEAKLQNE